LQASKILRTPSRASEVRQRFKLLWAAVKKGNTNAEIDLAELFRKGRGVVKNCDQARILLSAAARKGSAEARNGWKHFSANAAAIDSFHDFFNQGRFQIEYCFTGMFC